MKFLCNLIILQKQKKHKIYFYKYYLYDKIFILNETKKKGGNMKIGLVSYEFKNGKIEKSLELDKEDILIVEI